ncbi:MAG: helix-turn-helix transcriptional regulator [Oscillospiraceae bacterium]
MTLGERIKVCRKNSGMSQEKVAELVGVSRQAVTKWESDRSAPSTENLFKLAEIFGTTVDMLLNSDGGGQSAARELYCIYKQEEEKRLADRRKRLRKNAVAALIVMLCYLGAYLAGRFIWCSFSENSFMGWLVTAAPSGNGSYLYGWLLSSKLFWAAMAVSTVPALFGKCRFSFLTFGAFVTGLLAGIAFGPNPEGAPYGISDYGWAIWGGVYLLSIIAGTVWELIFKKTKNID